MFSSAIYINEFPTSREYDGERKYADGVLGIDNRNENDCHGRGHGKTERQSIA